MVLPSERILLRAGDILVIDNATYHTEKVTVICVNLVYMRDDTLNGICCISMEHPRAPTAIESYLCDAAERVMIYIYRYRKIQSKRCCRLRIDTIEVRRIYHNAIV